MVNFNSQPSVRLKCMVAIQFRARVKPRFQSTSKATVCIFDTVAVEDGLERGFVKQRLNFV